VGRARHHAAARAVRLARYRCTGRPARDGVACAGVAARLPAARVLVEPTFHKHVGKLCHGAQIHTEDRGFGQPALKPRRIHAVAFKAIRRLSPDFPLWRDFPYEYERGKLAIDVINGGPLLREWVDDAAATPQDLDALAIKDEQAWLGERAAHLRY